MGCRIGCRLAYFEAIFRNILHHCMSSYHLSIILPFHLNLLKLFLQFNLLLLLWRNSLPIITITGRLRSNLLLQYPIILVLLQLMIRVTILPREEPPLSLPLAPIDNGCSFRGRAF